MTFDSFCVYEWDEQNMQASKCITRWKHCYVILSLINYY